MKRERCEKLTTAERHRISLRRLIVCRVPERAIDNARRKQREREGTTGCKLIAAARYSCARSRRPCGSETISDKERE